MAARGRSLGHARLRVGFCLGATSRVSPLASRTVSPLILAGPSQSQTEPDESSFPLALARALIRGLLAVGLWSVRLTGLAVGVRGRARSSSLSPFSHTLDLNSDETTP